MNISNISFKGTDNNYRRTASSARTSAAHNGVYSENASIQRNNLRRNSGLDSYESSSTKKQQPQPKPHHKIDYSKLALLGIAIIEAIALTAPSDASPNELVKVQVGAGEDVGIYGEMYGSTEDAIMAYNKLQSDITPYAMEISIPAMYEHPVVGEIEEVQNELFTKKLDAEERAEKQEEVAELLEIQQLQSEIATSYTDGDFVYYTLTLPRGESATSTQSSYGGSINVEDFKDIFGIKDGVLRKHNNLDFTWGSNGYESYMDYTDARFYNGQTVKVPADAISMKYVEVDED